MNDLKLTWDTFKKILRFAAHDPLPLWAVAAMFKRVPCPQTPQNRHVGYVIIISVVVFFIGFIPIKHLISNEYFLLAIIITINNIVSFLYFIIISFAYSLRAASTSDNPEVNG